MSPVRHTITGSALSFSLAQELPIIREQLGSASARIGRTLVKEGPLRVTLVGLNAGGMLRPHKAEGPITVHVIEGEIEFEAEDKSWTCPPEPCSPSMPASHTASARRKGASFCSP